MTEVNVSNEMKLILVRYMADDLFAIETAQVSTGKHELGFWEPDDDLDPQRFLNALMNPRHGVPWEHTYFTFAVEVPIFVQRQWVKHRISSMNEVSGRYSKLIPKFYSNPARPMVNVGTRMKPKMIEAQIPVQSDVGVSDRYAAQAMWDEYEKRLDMGIAEEYARIVLPVGFFTQFYWSLNGRSLMNFLERRVESEEARVPTHPQWEIDWMAQCVEEGFAQAMPMTHKAFVAAGRVAP